jgi:protein-S-isoprenylcysteine O-methyltransferase Ste14
MRLDVRFPIGGMFAIIGAMLTVYGVVSPSALYRRSLGINVNLWWGLVLVVFGLVMLVFAFRALKDERRTEK